jgi:CheY-like chemotaxis protein
MTGPAICATGPQRRILLATKDPLLRQTRKEVLISFGYHVSAPIGEIDVLTSIQSEHFDVLVLGDTLDPDNKRRFATKYRNRQPHGRVVEIVVAFGYTAFGNPDAAVVGLDGPLALQHAIEEQLRFTS